MQNGLEKLIAAVNIAEGVDIASPQMRSAQGWLPGADEAAVPKP